MKKILLVLMLLASAAAGFAQEEYTEDDSRRMDQVRSQIGKMKRDMDKLMKEVISAYPDDTFSGIYGADVRVDIAEGENAFTVKADLPGMAKDKINIVLEKNRILKISGERETMKQETKPGMVKQERSSGRFERVVELPAECMSEGIKASYTSGVLEIVIPKKTPSKPESVSIKVE